MDLGVGGKVTVSTDAGGFGAGGTAAASAGERHSLTDRTAPVPDHRTYARY